MADAAPTVVLHAGAHKTATTHLQHSLHGGREALEQVGVRFFGPFDLRQQGARLEARFNLPSNPRPAVADLRPPSEVRADMIAGGSRLVLSEENVIGVLFDRKAPGPLHRIPRPLYPTAADNLTALAQKIAPEHGLDICLAIRDPAGFLNSAYSLALRAGSGADMTQFKRQNPLAMVNWADLVARLRRAPGLRHITVWRYEDYERLFDRITHTLVGPDGPQLSPVPAILNPGLSTAAVQYVLDHHAEASGGPLMELARDTYPVGPEHAAHDGYDKRERDKSAALYDAQWAAITAMNGVRVLCPEDAADPT